MLLILNFYIFLGGNEDDMAAIEVDCNAMVGVEGMTSNDLDEEDWLTPPPKKIN